MKYLEDFISPTREELAQWDGEHAKKMDEINREIYKRNRFVVNLAKRILSDVHAQTQGVRDLEAPAIQIEYSRLFRDQQEKERETKEAAFAGDSRRMR